MTTYDYIRRANQETKNRLESLVNEYNDLYHETDGDTYSLIRSGWGHETHWVLGVRYSDDDPGDPNLWEIGLFQCECGAILTEGEIEESECTGCWEKFE